MTHIQYQTTWLVKLNIKEKLPILEKVAGKK
jgi:hypothetical protein